MATDIRDVFEDTTVLGGKYVTLLLCAAMIDSIFEDGEAEDLVRILNERAEALGDRYEQILKGVCDDSREASDRLSQGEGIRA